MKKCYNQMREFFILHLTAQTKNYEQNPPFILIILQTSLTFKTLNRQQLP